MAYEDIYRITKELEDLLMIDKERILTWEEEQPDSMDRQNEICLEEETTVREQDIAQEEEEKSFTCRSNSRL